MRQNIRQKLIRQLTPLLAGYFLVSEEGFASQVYLQNTEHFWLLEPLDCHKKFVVRYGELTVNIALIEEERSVFWIVYARTIAALYWDGAELGAFQCIGDQTIAIKAGNQYRVMVSKSHFNEATQLVIVHLGKVLLVQAISSHKFSRVGEGEIDIYQLLISSFEWYTAAAQAALEGAGGAVMDLQCMPLQYGKFEALNPALMATRDTALIPA